MMFPDNVEIYAENLFSVLLNKFFVVGIRICFEY